jgi:uncharacterized protein YceH (UPF0502 family)
MKIELTPHEARALACLVEKLITTPEQYPLSVNALTNACNQKSNRDPMLNLSDQEVQGLIDALSRKHLVIERSGFGSRVPKYQQRFCNTEFSVLQFTPQERAVLVELMLRGPQTPGELRARAARMAEVSDVSDVEAALAALAAREGGPLVVRLSRQAGRRDARWAHLFCGPVEDVADSQPETDPPVASGASESMASRVARLETQVAELRQQLAELQSSQDR